ncbi:MAG: HD domain-containing protein [Bacteroidia bacterium]|nr:HD domain-containing protein [Bacteroidia bacterium]
MTFKQKILNDPIYGFINISGGLVQELIEHPYFQRLRRIMQLGLTYMVYPGAFHARFQHALGATHLMDMAIQEIRAKGHKITREEEEGAKVAILLHDIGHGPFSHTLEHDIIENITHEDISAIFMKKLNDEFNGKLSLAIEIFNGNYSKNFLHQLVSGQLDVDRLDYLKRDSFFTGVSEGVIGYDRIIKMLEVVDDQLVVESKGIYSIEKFLIARRLMYWQVYFHKTVLAAEQMLVNILKRAKYLADSGVELFATPALATFLYNKIKKKDFISNGLSFSDECQLRRTRLSRARTEGTRLSQAQTEGTRLSRAQTEGRTRLNRALTNNKSALEQFASLDDYDILTSVKVWADCQDKILSKLCTSLINRQLYKIEMQKIPHNKIRINELKKSIASNYKIEAEDTGYFVFTGSISNNAYRIQEDTIKILYKNNALVDITEASDVLNVNVLDKEVVKYFLCYPKDAS